MKVAGKSGGFGITEQTLSRKAGGGIAAPAAADLLAWYDRHRRVLPWRALPGEAADPYRVWLSEIMLQQTGAKTVGPYFNRFTHRWPTLAELGRASPDDVLREWAGLGYYARARNLHACARVVAAEHGGKFPRSEKELRTLPGVGAYTAAAIAAIAFEQRAIAIDGNIERVVTRLFAIEETLPSAKPKVRGALENLVPHQRVGDFTQALMDLGATICTPKGPACALCPWMAACAARARGDAVTFPRKDPKKEGLMRYGLAFVAVRADGAVLLRTRPEKGLLGGMTEVPGTPWTHEVSAEVTDNAPLFGAWQRLPGTVEHVFTHFPLRLTVFFTAVPDIVEAPPGTRFVASNEVAGEALPTLFRKVLAHAGVLAPAVKKPNKISG